MDILQYTFMQRALIAGAIVGALCAIIGVYVVLRGMSFVGAGIAHASFGGVALGFLLGINPIITAVFFCIATALGIGAISRKGDIKEDTAVGIFFSATMALGILFIGLSKGYSIDLFGYLFGSILAVTQFDLIITTVVGIIVLLIIAALYKEFMFISFDAETAAIVGIPVVTLYYLLLAIIALTIVVSIKVVGIILVSALIIIPAATAFQIAEDFRLMMLLSTIFGVVSSIGGLFLSYALNTASGATIVLLATVIFFITAAISPRRRRRRYESPDNIDAAPSCMCTAGSAEGERSSKEGTEHHEEAECTHKHTH
ncbi:MAG: metal ABC transporter permease [Vulcanimicrobiota bacterium]